MTSATSPALRAELELLGADGLRRAAAAAASQFAGDGSPAAPTVDPIPVVLGAEEWEQLTAGLIQRLRLLDALHADLYGPRTVLTAELTPVAELLADPRYLRTAVGIPSARGGGLFALATTVIRKADGSWAVLEDAADVPDGAGTALELRRVLSRSTPALYRSTPLRRLHPFFDTARAALHERLRARGRAGRAVVLIDDRADPLRAADHHWIANLLGAPAVSPADLRTGSGSLTLRLPGPDRNAQEPVDAVLRLIPSQLLDPLDLGPTPLDGVTGLVEAARCGDVEVLNPLGAGLLENPALREALPDLCRHLLHEDLQLRPAPAQAKPAGAASLDPEGGNQLVERPVQLRLLVLATAEGYEVMPGGVARTADAHAPALKDIWVQVPQTAGSESLELSLGASSPRDLATYPAMSRSIGSDLFWFGRYLERVDATARLLRTVLDTVNDLDAEPGTAARTAQGVLLRAITEVTTTSPGFHAVDLSDAEEVTAELASLLGDRTRPGSLAQSFEALAHSSRTLRDVVSEDVWPVIARLRRTVRTLDPAGPVPLEQGLTAVIDGCLTFSGAIADSMPRTLGWDLLEAGRKLERSLTVLALLRAILGRRRARRVEARTAAALVAITESGASYRRAFHAAAQPELVLELLLADPALPRSIAFQLQRLGQVLDRLPEGSPSAALRTPLTALRSRVAEWEPRELLCPLEGPDGADGADRVDRADEIDGPDGVDGPDGAPTALLAEADAAVSTLRELATKLEQHYFHASESTSHWGIDDV
ncbi:circularly permuted type 2 ATP-grasp protein [Brachybacterium sp. UMB0905]|uniref:circularly permuted type 2 ATP-grasp protein n=1 Tax=Brachybacterium sp. UMB0905 TaxID=2069310 RepID=UPI000C7FAEBE|nr:circularly permuted type 2 ATP-grasp protein [Brachybacterium sp. UMB0905]PMC75630.1 hypothetical protein CJ197_07795 [Brachybacterium sp. UMB0905]